jgi:hypothetical protein
MIVIALAWSDGSQLRSNRKRRKQLDSNQGKGAARTCKRRASSMLSWVLGDTMRKVAALLTRFAIAFLATVLMDCGFANAQVGPSPALTSPFGLDPSVGQSPSSRRANWNSLGPRETRDSRLMQD